MWGKSKFNRPPRPKLFLDVRINEMVLCCDEMEELVLAGSPKATCKKSGFQRQPPRPSKGTRRVGSTHRKKSRGTCLHVDVIFQVYDSWDINHQ